MPNEKHNKKVIPANEFFAQNNVQNTSSNRQNANKSNTNSSYSIPDSITKRFNWGAFILDWIWGLGNKSYITLITLPLWILCFVPQFALLSVILNFGLSIWFGIKGNAWAWHNKHFDSIEAFHNYQNKWEIAAIISIIICVVVVLVIPLILFWTLLKPVNVQNPSDSLNFVAKYEALNQIEHSILMNETLGKKCELSSTGLAECFEKTITGYKDGNNITIPLFVVSNGYIRVDENYLTEYKNKNL